MSDITQYNRIFFVGIGGIGMSALARYFRAGGYQVAGYDRTSSAITDALEKEDIQIIFDDNVDAIPSSYKEPAGKEDTLVIYTPAIPANHPGMKYFREQGYTLFKRAQVLGMIADRMRPVAVAGTHGKTTTSTMIAHVMKQSILDCSAFLGGISKNYDSNLLLGESDWVVLEADEFDRSFLFLHPEVAVITSMDADHLDIYHTHEQLIKTFHQFISQVRSGGRILMHYGLSVDRSVNPEVTWFTYGLDEKADYYATELSYRDGYHIFNVHTPEGEIHEIHLGLPGKVNVENALAAIAVAHLLGISEESIKKSLFLFKGVRRRFDIRVNTPGQVYIDDYAHHPVELKAAIESAREMFPGMKITGIFQPHLYTRTRDFARAFAESLDLLDTAVLLNIYPAREKPVPGITSRVILDQMKIKDKILINKEEAVAWVEKYRPELLLTLGAGDIDRLVEPVEKIFNKEQ
ncbi:MAG TPA: UDP-N-acetylmuramate--L-alanine ligase [Bacteroidetes bacterium]|nr:UDP-N-acetylmuramate--L-alanine ligase [Bacteroidota bacterium]